MKAEEYIHALLHLRICDLFWFFLRFTVYGYIYICTDSYMGDDTDLKIPRITIITLNENKYYYKNYCFFEQSCGSVLDGLWMVEFRETLKGNKKNIMCLNVHNSRYIDVYRKIFQSLTSRLILIFFEICKVLREPYN